MKRIFLQKINKIKQERAITLIALIVTIIVLIILAGVSIQMLTGENGIITKAQEAKRKMENATTNELADLSVVENILKNLRVGEEEENVNLSTLETLIYDVNDLKATVNELKSNFLEVNSVSSSNVESFGNNNFTLNANSYEYISGNSKFGEFNANNELVFNQSGLYYLSTNIKVNNTTSANLYNFIDINGITMTESIVLEGIKSGAPTTVTFYANEGDKVKVYIKNSHSTNSRDIDNWNVKLYKIF